ncbi:MAG: T9SS type B sorting domain-containing protein [Bacteroidia bacterium]
MRIRLFCFCLLFTFLAKAQPGKEAWHWEFGSACSMDFSSGVAVPGVAWSFGAIEGTASYSDPITGQLIMYASGVVVINKNGNTMYNGVALKGHTSSTQGALIIPKPGSNTIYYVITSDQCASNNHGVFYSVVDLTLHGGLGEVVLKNQILTPPPATEKLVGARQCNGTDYWIITHPLGTNCFNAYSVTSAGINPTPVVSCAGTVQKYISPTYDEGIGYMKISPDGSKLALGVCSDSIPILEILDFNNSTGVVSNPLTIRFPNTWGVYGVSFSPDNSKLYAGVYPYDTTSCIYQYDLTSNTSSIIIASQTLIAKRKYIFSTGKYQFGAMQIAPDGKIYIARSSEDSLAFINNPNTLGAACNFVLNGINILGGSWSYYGLPNFIDANYAGIQIDIPDVQQCNTFTATTLDAGSGFAGYFWSTGASTQTISINTPGQYWVTVTNDQGCTRTDTVNAYLLNPIKEDTLACDTFKANVVQAGVLQYNWFDGSNAPIRNFTQSGTYYVDINYVRGCAIRDSITVTIVPSPQINIGPDTTFCKGELKMDAACSTCNYQWSTGETSSAITVKTPGVYSVTVKDSNGCVDSDTLTIRPQLSVFNFEMPNIVTPNDDNINDVVDFKKYQFTTFQIHIFNRWGQEIFKSEDPNAVWKPTQDDGTYYYTTQYKIDCTVDSQTKTLKGFITIVR